MKLRRIGAISLAKICGILYGAIGLIIGLMVSFAVILGVVVGSRLENSIEPLAGTFIGLAAIFLFPIFYGIIGFITGLFSAGIYNLATRFVGGLELEFEELSASP